MVRTVGATKKLGDEGTKKDVVGATKKLVVGTTAGAAAGTKKLVVGATAGTKKLVCGTTTGADGATKKLVVTGVLTAGTKYEVVTGTLAGGTKKLTDGEAATQAWAWAVVVPNSVPHTKAAAKTRFRMMFLLGAGAIGQFRSLRLTRPLRNRIARYKEARR